jgi:hypothetical protein
LFLDKPKIADKLELLFDKILLIFLVLTISSVAAEEVESSKDNICVVIDVVLLLLEIVVFADVFADVFAVELRIPVKILENMIVLV